MQVFNYGDFQVRAVKINGRSWISLSDVCLVFHYRVGLAKKFSREISPLEVYRSVVEIPGMTPYERLLVTIRGIQALSKVEDLPRVGEFIKWLEIRVVPYLKEE